MKNLSRYIIVGVLSFLAFLVLFTKEEQQTELQQVHMNYEVVSEIIQEAPPLTPEQISILKKNLHSRYIELYEEIKNKDNELLAKYSKEVISPEILFAAEEFFPEEELSDALKKSVKALSRLYVEVFKKENLSKEELLHHAVALEDSLINVLK